MEMQDVEVRRMQGVMDDAEQHIKDSMSSLDYVSMTTRAREIDPYEPHCLLCGMGATPPRTSNAHPKPARASSTAAARTGSSAARCWLADFRPAPSSRA